MKASGITAIFTFLLKIITLLGFLIGMGFIIFGCILETPPKTAIPASLVTVGVLTMLASLLGYAGSQFRPQLLLAYLIVGAVGTLAQLAIVLAIFFAQSAVATAIVIMNTEGSVTAAVVMEKDRQYILDKLEVGKWIFLWVVLGEAGSLALALIMRLMGKLEGRYDNLELDEVNQLHDMELQGIHKNMTNAHKVTNKNEDRLAAKMHKKYGSSSGVDFLEGRRWYNFGR